jgi:hypothetical protein
MAAFWKVSGLVALVVGVVLFFGYNPGPRDYSGGHEVPHTFEVFSRENPPRELLGIFLFMILPVAIATGLRLLVSYLAARRSRKPFQLRTPLPIAIMCGIVFALSAFIFWVLARDAYRFSSMNYFFVRLVDAVIIFGGPALLFVVPVLLLARYQKFIGKEAAIPDWFMYATSTTAFVAQYFWWSAFNKA